MGRDQRGGARPGGETAGLFYEGSGLAADLARRRPKSHTNRTEGRKAFRGVLRQAEGNRGAGGQRDLRVGNDRGVEPGAGKTSFSGNAGSIDPQLLGILAHHGGGAAGKTVTVKSLERYLDAMNPSPMPKSDLPEDNPPVTPAGQTGQPQRRITAADWAKLISHPKYTPGLFEAKGFVLPATGARPPALPEKEDGR